MSGACESVCCVSVWSGCPQSVIASNCVPASNQPRPLPEHGALSKLTPDYAGPISKAETLEVRLLSRSQLVWLGRGWRLLCGIGSVFHWG
jgi:hypothetical protein